jgi:DNA-directed RNA polymerase beta subunit
MERDALIAHGISTFLNEKLMEPSDMFVVHICDECGGFASRVKNTTNKQYMTQKDNFVCEVCNNFSNISKIVVPYAFK